MTDTALISSAGVAEILGIPQRQFNRVRAHLVRRGFPTPVVGRIRGRSGHTALWRSAEVRAWALAQDIAAPALDRDRLLAERAGALANGEG